VLRHNRSELKVWLLSQDSNFFPSGERRSPRFGGEEVELDRPQIRETRLAGIRDPDEGKFAGVLRRLLFNGFLVTSMARTAYSTAIAKSGTKPQDFRIWQRLQDPDSNPMQRVLKPPVSSRSPGGIVSGANTTRRWAAILRMPRQELVKR
jgi:hypothetical protein